MKRRNSSSSFAIGPARPRMLMSRLRWAASSSSSACSASGGQTSWGRGALTVGFPPRIASSDIGFTPWGSEGGGRRWPSLAKLDRRASLGARVDSGLDELHRGQGVVVAVLPAVQRVQERRELRDVGVAYLDARVVL